MRDFTKTIYHLRKSILFLISLHAVHVTLAQSNVGESAPGFLTSMPPNAPVLSEPADQAKNVPVELSLSWFSQIHTGTYTLKLSESPDLTDPFIEQTDLSDTTYTVSGLEHDATYYWQVRGTNDAGDGPFSNTRGFSTTSVTSVKQNAHGGMNGFSMNVYPNPFHSTVNVDYQIPEETEVLITVINQLGQAVQYLDEGLKPPGRYQWVWNGQHMSGEHARRGVYFLLFQSNAGHVTRKMILIR
jgi:hypothetical protein